jgi:phage shock protein C
MIAGVCGGLAEWLGWHPTVVHVLYVLVSILSAAFPDMLVFVSPVPVAGRDRTAP